LNNDSRGVGEHTHIRSHNDFRMAKANIQMRQSKHQFAAASGSNCTIMDRPCRPQSTLISPPPCPLHHARLAQIWAKHRYKLKFMRLVAKVNSLHHQLPCLIAMHDLGRLAS